MQWKWYSNPYSPNNPIYPNPKLEGTFLRHLILCVHFVHHTPRLLPIPALPSLLPCTHTMPPSLSLCSFFLLSLCLPFSSFLPGRGGDGTGHASLTGHSALRQTLAATATALHFAHLLFHFLVRTGWSVQAQAPSDPSDLPGFLTLSVLGLGSPLLSFLPHSFPLPSPYHSCFSFYHTFLLFGPLEPVVTWHFWHF